MSKIFITGATGFIGSHLADELLKRGNHVKCLVRESSSTKWLKDKPFEFVYGNLFKKDVLKTALADVDYVYHVGGVNFAKRKEDYFKGNADSTKSLIETCYEINPGLKRFVHLSSQTVTGPSLNVKPVNEETVCNPITTYGRSKLEAEKIVLQYFDKMNCTIIRAPAVYGPRDAAIFEYFKTMNKGLQPMIGFDNKTLSLIHSSDLVRGMILAGESQSAKSKIYFISSGKFFSWKEIGDITSRLLGRKTLTIRIPHFAVYTVGAFAQFFAMFSDKPAILNLEKCRDITQSHWICSSEKAGKELGFREEMSIEKGIEDTISWYKDNRWLK